MVLRTKDEPEQGVATKRTELSHEDKAGAEMPELLAWGVTECTGGTTTWGWSVEKGDAS